MFRVLGILSFLAVSCAASAAFACDPAPSHQVQIEEHDAPDCLNVDDAFTYGAAELVVYNECEEVAVVESLECHGCGEPVEVQPGELANFVIESRTLSEGARSSQTLAWVVGEQEGTISTVVTYYDNSDACAGWGDPRGPLCSAAPGGSVPLSPLTVVSLLLGMAVLSMRRLA